MNISGLIRSLVGDLQASDSKVLELKVGQIVKGLVLQLLSDQEALVNIGGVQVRAKLETPLKQGDVTLLQVQPESTGNQIMLKPLASSDVQIADESMADLLKGFQLKDVAQNRQMVQQIQQEGVPLTKETVQAFAALQTEMPEGVTKEEWTQAAVLAFKRGLPLTFETVSALKQVTSGPPMGDVLERLEQQATALLKEQPAMKAADTLTQVVSVLKELRATATAAWTARPPEHEAPAPAAAQQPSAGAPPAAPSGPPQSPSGSASAPATDSPAAAPPAAVALASTAPRVEARAAAPAQPAAVPPAAAPEGAAIGKAQARSAEPVKQAPQEPATAHTPEAAPDNPPAAENWIGRLLKAVGVEHEHQLAKLVDKPETAATAAADELLSALTTQVDDADTDGPKPAADTLKSLLLQLTASDDLPGPLKETAQQALQQVTGQQLLLTNDRGSLFSHVTLFIPFMDGTGQQSASIHIQSRKGKRGEVDADNCRLLFDLQMKEMGNTLVDVQVVNKIVSLHVHNDHPMLVPLMEGSREEISQALNKVGYQFFSLKTSPFPELTAPKESLASKDHLSSGTRNGLKSIFEPKPYKGVDYRA
jgi:hypothetical protein